MLFERWVGLGVFFSLFFLTCRFFGCKKIYLCHAPAGSAGRELRLQEGLGDTELISSPPFPASKRKRALIIAKLSAGRAVWFSLGFGSRLIKQPAAACWVTRVFNDGSASEGESSVIAPGGLASLSLGMKAGNLASMSQDNWGARGSGAAPGRGTCWVPWGQELG